MYKENILKKLKASKITILKRTVLIAVVVLILVSLLVVSPKKASAITLKELGNAIARLSQGEESLLEEILVSEIEIENKRNKIKSLNGELEVLKNQLEELNETRKELSESIENKKDILTEKVIFSYKYGNNDVLKIITSAGISTPRSIIVYPPPSSIIPTKFLPISCKSPCTVPIIILPLVSAPDSESRGFIMSIAACIALAAISTSGM
ncbi:unnamed protein product [marine sediment metagenome]|uniref:Uncharacterized protein n=1 Tax=marine sediment metagenome TaxID=412755 RepID=X1SUB9_9ZZZZ